MKLTVAVLQYDAPLKTEESVSKLDEMVSKAVKARSRLVVAPETAIGDAREVKATGVNYLPLLTHVAVKHKVYIATSFYRKSGKKYFNQGYVVAPDGKPVLTHRKIYLAKPEMEDIGVVAGRKLQVAQTDIGKLGMLICKDGFNKYAHFLYERLGKLGAEVVCIPTWSIGWKELDTKEYVKALYAYGAFTSRAYVLMSGNLNKESRSFGRSLIVSPTKGILREGSIDKEEVLVEEIDLNETGNARKFDLWWQPKKRII